MNMNYPTISMRELECWICYGRPMELIDLRNRRAFGYSHLMNAVNFPFEELEATVPRRFPAEMLRKTNPGSGYLNYPPPG